MSFKNKTIHVVVAFVIIVGILVSALVIYNNSVNKSLKSHTDHTISEVINQQQHSLETLFEERSTIIQMLSKAFSANIVHVKDKDRNSLYQAVSKANFGSGFEQIILCFPQSGLGLTSKNKVVDFSNEAYFKNVKKDEVYISEVFTDENNNRIIAFSTPVYANDVLVSVLIGHYNTNDMNKAFTSAFKNSAFTFVCDPNGNIITSTINNTTNISSEQLTETLKSEDFQQIFITSQKETTAININNNQLILRSSPLDFKGWYIFTAIPYSVIAKEISGIAAATAILTLIITGGFILLLLYLIIKQKKYSGELYKVAYYDKLTNMPNLEKFKMEATELIKNNPDMQFYFIIFDINNFKIINEMYGKKGGDEVICTIADLLFSISKKGNCACARINADTFIIADCFKEFDEIEKSRQAFESAFKSRDIKAKLHKIEFRYGRYVIEKNDTDIDLMIEKAHLAHNIARQSKVNTIFDYDRAVKQNLVLEAKIENAMENALNNGEFVVYLQAKYHLDTEMVVGAEALARWIKNDGFVAYPNEFIPIFEKNGFIVKLDMYMLEQVCQIIKSWMESGKKIVTVSVNFSRLHLNTEDFVKKVEAVVVKYGIPKKYIEIELTESTMFDNEETLQKILEELHETGFTLSMDDFGTGYSSLGLLKNLPVDVIKIDKAFFTANRDKSRSRTIIESVIQMAKKLNIDTVAEGVEIKEHVDLLKEIGCDIVQGYYYAKPQPASDFSAGNAVFNPQAATPENIFDFDDLGDVTIGRTTIGTTLPVFVYRLFQFSLRKVLIKLYGEGQMISVLRRTGKIAGRVFATEMLDLSLPFEEFATTLSKQLEESKIGLLKIESFDQDTNIGVLTITDDLDCSGVTNSDETLCQYEEGFISGIFYEYTKLDFSVVEVSCWGTGGYTCRFEIKPR